MDLNHWEIIERGDPVTVGVSRQKPLDHHHYPDDYSIYLAHPPVLLSQQKKMYSSKGVVVSTQEKSSSSSFLLSDQILLIETEFRAGEQQQPTPTPTPTQQLEDFKGGCNYYYEVDNTIMLEDTLLPATATTTTSLDYTEWSFSILLHATWRVPTLYFSCCHSDGTPLCRREVLDMLLLPRELSWINDASVHRDEEQNDDNNNDDEDDDELSWEFVSQEEHPITGQPSYFLHPCRTAERMELMMSYHQCHRHHHQVGQQHVSKKKQIIKENEIEVKGDEDVEHRIIPLLSWMSMILPVVGCRLSPEVFCRVRRNLRPQETKRFEGESY